ncbi:hypothetical protein K2173_024981 [Erythroxylum novogranatense]|uniref:Scarecrow-like protein 6 n=1 Tax=Erythroxylum novogranatense TaxID=1862640 RepID=A0AAV8UI54_9ROSI|nr:hypothetical protein K2173_024981 [Erythroxylum novogranatense]
MKAMPLTFEGFQGKGVLEFSSSSSSSFLDSLLQERTQEEQQRFEQKWQSNINNIKGSSCFVGSEPTSVLDAIRSPSSPTSSSTLSSFQGSGNGGGGGASTDTTTTTTTTNGLATAVFSGNNNSHPSSVEISAEKCVQLGMEDWESVLSGSPSQEQSILRLIMGDNEDPSLGFNKLLPSGSGPEDVEFNAGFGVVDQVFGFDAMNNANLVSNIHDPSTLQGPSSEFPLLSNNPRIGSLISQQISNPDVPVSTNSLLPVMFHQPQQGIEANEEKPQILNPSVIINQSQHQFGQNPAMFLPLSYSQLQEHNNLLSAPPPPKRHNPGPNSQVQNVPFSDLKAELFVRRQNQHHQQQNQLQMFQQQRPGGVTSTKQKLMSDELAIQQLQQAIINQICQAAELIETGNAVLAQGILARLNHQLSLPIGKPYHRVAFYFKEALQLLLHTNNSSNNTMLSSPCSLIFKIGAYKSFSEISPILQFANFTCNQALLEAFEGFDRIHIVDFDIGYGGQWASLMQELSMRSGGAPSLKITAFASPSSHSDLELGFTRENLRIFAGEINMPFELEIFGLESLNSGSWPSPIRMLEKEVVAVNLPIGSFSSYPLILPLVLRFVKQLSPKVVVSLDRGCERTDLPFGHQVNQAIQSYSSLLESLDAVNVNLDAMQKIERFLVQPGVEKLVLGRHRCPDRTSPWKSLFLQSGFTPLTFSNFAESQADCLVQRAPVKGFHVEKKQASLVLCWQRKELISASAWSC